jgi:DNA polymerase
MKIIALDFETFYSKDLGFSKHTTEEYLRHPDFEVIGVGIKEEGKDAQWFSGNKNEIKTFLDSLNLHEHLVLAHNAMFDAAILNWHFGIVPRGILDTLSMGRAVHTIEVGGSLAALAQYYGIGEKGTEVVNALGKRRKDFTPTELAAYGEYCKNDAELTLELFKILSNNFDKSELKLIDLTIRMFTEPVLELDEAMLRRYSADVYIQKRQLLDAITMVDRDQLMSSEKFAGALRALNVEPPTKISPTTGKETYALAKTDEGMKALLDHENPNVQALAAARLGFKSTLEETRTQRFIEIATRGAMPVPLSYYAAHTGRWGGADKINLQNLGRVSAIKMAIKAPEGYMMIDADSSQIEARTLAWLAGQDDLVEAFDRGEDVYKIMASAIYSKPVEEINKEERFVGKTTILGCGYGMGAVKFQAALLNAKPTPVKVELNEAKHIIDTYRRTYPKIVAFWKIAGKALDAIRDNQFASIGRNEVLKIEGQNGIRLPNGMYIKYPNLRQQRNDDGTIETVYDTKKGKATVPNRIYGGKVTENVCQALARIIIGKQMLQIAKKYRVVMTVHDAVACIVPENEVTRAVEYVGMCMRLRPDWGMELPLNYEAGYGRSYGEC